MVVINHPRNRERLTVAIIILTDDPTLGTSWRGFWHGLLCNGSISQWWGRLDMAPVGWLFEHRNLVLIATCERVSSLVMHLALYYLIDTPAQIISFQIQTRAVAKIRAFGRQTSVSLCYLMKSSLIRNYKEASSYELGLLKLVNRTTHRLKIVWFSVNFAGFCMS